VAVDEDENEISISSTSDEADAPVVKLLNLIIIEQSRQTRLTIHIEPMNKNTRVRYRVTVPCVKL